MNTAYIQTMHKILNQRRAWWFFRVYREDTVLVEIVPNSELQRFIEEGGYSISPV